MRNIAGGIRSTDMCCLTMYGAGSLPFRCRVFSQSCFEMALRLYKSAPRGAMLFLETPDEDAFWTEWEATKP